MSDIEVELEGFDELIRDFEDADFVIEDETYLTMEVSLAAFHQAVVVETPSSGIGALRASIASEIEGQKFDLTGRVSTPLIYGLPVEFGRRAGRAPLEKVQGKIKAIGAIELWVIRKGLQWTYKGEQMTTHQMAYVIARAIGRGTTKFQKEGGARMFEKGFANALPLVEGYWDKMLDRVVERLTR